MYVMPHTTKVKKVNGVKYLFDFLQLCFRHGSSSTEPPDKLNCLLINLKFIEAIHILLDCNQFITWYIRKNCSMMAKRRVFCQSPLKIRVLSSVSFHRQKLGSFIKIIIKCSVPFKFWAG